MDTNDKNLVGDETREDDGTAPLPALNEPDEKGKEQLIKSEDIDSQPNVPTKKDFKFSKPIDTLYDETAVEPTAEIEDLDKLDRDNPNDQDENSVKKGKKTKVKKKGCLRALILTMALICLATIIAAFTISSFLDMTAFTKPDNKVDITIKSSQLTAAQIADELKDAGIINNSIAFRLYCKYKNYTVFHEGTYTLNSNMSYGELASELRKTYRESVKVLIPEGKTVEQIDKILTDKKVCDEGDFIAASKAGGFKFSLDSQIPNNPKRFLKYEGYFFPDTYEFYVGSSGKAACQKILDNMDKKFDASMKEKAASMNMTVDQVITLASIIQAETGKEEQMYKVSSVFHNRLEKGVSEAGGKKLLQSDATIFYATRDIKPVLPQSSTEILSAYNSYKNEGLPPGPICNPGLAAIKAALNPETTDYYYFVTDSSGNYYYAKTYSEHLKNVKKALKTSAAKGTDVFQ